MIHLYSRSAWTLIMHPKSDVAKISSRWYADAILSDFVTHTLECIKWIPPPAGLQIIHLRRVTAALMDDVCLPLISTKSYVSFSFSSWLLIAFSFLPLFCTHLNSCSFLILLSYLSLLHLTLILLSLLFLDYDFGDIFPVLQSLPSADWEGGTLVNPSPSSYHLIYHGHYTVYGYAYCMLGPSVCY